jgi:rRNA maturation RNase YbeY
MLQNSNIRISFFFLKKITLNNRTRLKSFLSEVLKTKAKKDSGEIRIIFCSDEYLLKINREFLQHDYYTDIITFPLTDSREKQIEAELYISTDRVKENSEKGNFTQELHRVIFHGILHLCGLNDKTPAEQNRMKKAENQLLSEFFTTEKNA